MKTYTQEELKQILEKHQKWLVGNGDGRADLSYANLRHADLRSANLRSANLRSADLCYANLCYANLRYADLRYADLRYADLRYANLRYADLRYADLPAPPTLLLTNWQIVSDELCLELMRYDAANHPDPKAFDEWVKTGKCPYSDIKWQRSANFQEKPELWKPGKSKSALELVELLFKEKEIKR